MACKLCFCLALPSFLSFFCSFKAHALSLPSASELIDEIPLCDPLALHRVCEYVSNTLAQELRVDFENVLSNTPVDPIYEFSARAVGQRALVNKVYSYLSRLCDPNVEAKLLHRMRTATNMTDEISALASLDYDCPSRSIAMQEFFDKWKSNPLVLLKWLSLSAASNLPGNLDNVRRIASSDAFKITNPNCCYSLFGGFAASSVNYHAPDGSGYAYIADVVLQLDKVNHQVASRIVSKFTSFKQYDLGRQAAIKAQLQRIVSTPDLSPNVFEIANACLTK
jgi:aminopeptidase N